METYNSGHCSPLGQKNSGSCINRKLLEKIANILNKILIVIQLIVRVKLVYYIKVFVKILNVFLVVIQNIVGCQFMILLIN